MKRDPPPTQVIIKAKWTCNSELFWYDDEILEECLQ